MIQHRALAALGEDAVTPSLSTAEFEARLAEIRAIIGYNADRSTFSGMLRARASRKEREAVLQRLLRHRRTSQAAWDAARQVMREAPMVGGAGAGRAGGGIVTGRGTDRMTGRGGGGIVTASSTWRNGIGAAANASDSTPSSASSAWRQQEIN